MGDAETGRPMRRFRKRDDGPEPIGLFTQIARRPGVYGLDPDVLRTFTAFVNGFRLGNPGALSDLDDWLLDRISADAGSLVWWARAQLRYEETTGGSWDALAPRDQMWFLAVELDTYVALHEADVDGGLPGDSANLHAG